MYVKVLKAFYACYFYLITGVPLINRGHQDVKKRVLSGLSGLL